MAEQETGAPAGGAVLNEDAAADLIMGALIDDDPENTEQADGDASRAEAETGEADTAQAGEADTGEATESREDDGENEASDFYDFDKIHPDTQIRLRDGSVKRFGDIKRDWADLQELPRQRQEFETLRASHSQQLAKVAQQAQIFQQALPLIEAFAQANAPQVPQPPVNDPSDPIGNADRWAAYHDAVQKHQAFTGQMQQIMRARDQYFAQQRQEAERQQQEHIRLNQQKLVEVMPDMRDDAKRAQFAGEMRKFGKDVYGFSDQEIDAIGDYRIIPVLRDAIAYRKLQATKPKVADKVKDAAPVQKPGKRTSDAEQQASAYREKMARLRKSGSVDDAAALILEHHLL
jgi:hypothetical protein